MLTGVHHIVLFCVDTEASRQWYEKAGFNYSHGYDGMHWFELGSTKLMLHPGGKGASESAPKLHAAVADVDALLGRVLDAGLQPFDHQAPGEPLTAPVERPWGDREFELTDPDGHDWGFTAAD